MGDYERITIDFGPNGFAVTLPGITRRAVAEINRLWATLGDSERSGHLPSINLTFNTAGEDLVYSPRIGGHLTAAVPAEYVVDAHGLKVAFNLTDEAMTKYQDHVLDFIDGRFVFLDKVAAKFLDADR